MKQPETFEQCFEILDSKLNDEQKEMIIKSPTSVHRSVGRWIRNNFGLWANTNKILIQELQFLSKSLHPDNWSHCLLIQYQQHLLFSKLDLILSDKKKKEIRKNSDKITSWFADIIRFTFNMWGKTNKQISVFLKKYSDHLKNK